MTEMILLFVKCIAIVALAEILEMVYRRWGNRPETYGIAKKSFFPEMVALKIRALAAGRGVLWQNQLHQLWQQKRISARGAWFGIAILEQAFVLRFIITVALAVAAAWSGQLTGWNGLFDPRGEPASFLLFIASPESLPLFFCFGLGLLLGFLFKGRSVGAVVVISLMFPFLISTPGAALLIFGEMAGGTWKIRPGDKTWRGIWNWRASTSWLTALLFWIFGGVLHGALVAVGFDLMKPSGMLAQVGVLVALLWVTDLLLAMLGLHFGWTLAKVRGMLTDSLS